MQSGGILSPENLAAIFLNLQVTKRTRLFKLDHEGYVLSVSWRENIIRLICNNFEQQTGLFVHKKPKRDVGKTMILVGFNTHGDSLKNPEGILCREGNAQFNPWDLCISPRLFLTNETLEIYRKLDS